MVAIQLKCIQDCDIPLLEQWLNKEYVAKWYHNPEEWLYELKNRFDEFSFVKHFIVIHEERAIGFCQYYTCIDADEDWQGYKLSQGTYSIDYMIGEEAYLHNGYGKAIVAMLTSKVFSLEDATEIIVAPEQENLPSCKSLLANGFIYCDEYKLFYESKEMFYNGKRKKKTDYIWEQML